MAKAEASEVAKELRKKKPQAPEPVGLSTGLTLLNLAMSGRADVGFLAGHYYLFVGDSQAGKSWLVMQLLAEAAISPQFKDYRLVHNNPERGTLMNVRRYFGKLADRLEEVTPPSRTLEQFYAHVNATLHAGKVVYGLDSEDALPPEADVLRARKEEKALAAQGKKKAKAGDGEEEKKKGSYGTERARLNSSQLRIAFNNLDNGSILAVIKQARQNIGPDAYFNPKTRSGGLALTYYACNELWFSIKGKMRKKFSRIEKSVVTGSVLEIHVKKNRTAGRDRKVQVLFYPDIGFDETGTNVRYLLDWGHWEGSLDKDRVIAPEFKYEGTLDRLARKVEDEGREKDLRLLVVDCWKAIETECAVVRKPRY